MYVGCPKCDAIRHVDEDGPVAVCWVCGWPVPDDGKDTAEGASYWGMTSHGYDVIGHIKNVQQTNKGVTYDVQLMEGTE